MKFGGSAPLLVGALALASACSGSPQSLGDPDLDAGRGVYGRVCSTCHGPRGVGGSAPPLDSILGDFPACAEHIRWITIGSARWRDEVSPTYGPEAKPITGVMPSFERILTEEEIRQVAAYERFEIGGGEMDLVLTDCGLG